MCDVKVTYSFEFYDPDEHKKEWIKMIQCCFIDKECNEHCKAYVMGNCVRLEMEQNKIDKLALIAK